MKSKMRSSTTLTRPVRDEFPYDVKSALAVRVACLCSNPACRKLTHGPSRDRVDARVNAGCAAHICAAAKGGPRYDPGQTPAERRSASNGIWLCRNCGEIVDDDETTYPALVLRGWKAEAEADTERNLGRPPNEWGGAPARPEPRVTWSTNETVFELVAAGDAEEVPALDVLDPRGFTPDEVAGMSENDQTRASAYNAALAAWKVEFERVEVHNVECDRIIAAPLVKVTLHNDGRAPLLNAHCVVRFPPTLRIIGEKDVPDRRPYPAMTARPRIGPRRAETTSMLGQLVPIAPRGFVMPSFAMPEITVHDAGLDYEDGVWTGWKRSLKHNFNFEFERGVRVMPPGDAGEHPVAVEVHADNLPDPWIGQLVLRVQPRPPSPIPRWARRDTPTG